MQQELSEEQIKKLREKPSYFVEKVLDVEPFEYQKKVLDSNHDRHAIAAGRQVGKTTMMAWMAIHEFTMYNNRRIILVSRSNRQSLNFMKKLKAEISEWIENPDDYGLEYESKSKIEGKNGSWIEALPPVEETIRGYTADSIYVDEAAFLGNKLFTSILSPMLATTNGNFVIASTAWGQEGYFYDKVKEDDYWDSYQFSSIESPIIEPRQIEEWQRDMTEMEYDREIMARFSDKENAFFKNKDINKGIEWSANISDADNIIYPDQTGRECYMGVDPATTGDDDAVITSVDTEGNIFDVEVISQCEIPELEGEIVKALNMESRNYLEVLIEENGLGEGTVHRLEGEYAPVNGFRTTLRSKESIYNQLKNRLQKGDINVPDREDLISQMRSIEYEMTNSDNIKIHAPGEEHDDMADSVALAVAAKSGNKYVERQSQPYTFGSSSTESLEESSKRAFTIN